MDISKLDLEHKVDILIEHMECPDNPILGYCIDNPDVCKQCWLKSSTPAEICTKYKKGC